MLHLFNLLLISLVVMNVTGLTLLVNRWLRLPYGLALGAAVTALCLFFFFVEHFVGMGRLPALALPFSTVVSAWLVWKHREEFLARRPASDSTSTASPLHIFNVAFFGVLLITIIGGTFRVVSLASDRLPWLVLSYRLIMGAALLGFCAILLCIRLFGGFGRLRLEDVSPACSANGWFLFGFGYCLLWRYAFPDIDSQTERLADLSFVASYMTGVRLPSPDLWYPPFQLNHYYSFQHYGAGLLGRIFSLDAGTAYNVSYCLLTGLTMAAAYEAVAPLCRKRWGQALVLIAFLAGGTGASILTPLMINTDKNKFAEEPYDSMRFVGGTTFYEKERLTSFGLAIQGLGLNGKTREQLTRDDVLEMPTENFSYVVQLGDYHAPLAGFFLLAFSLGLACVLLGRPADHSSDRVHYGPGSASASAALAATIPLTMAADTWSLPLQVPLVAGVLFYVYMSRALFRPGARQLNWRMLLLGGAGTCFLLYPFFSYFLVNNVGNKTPIEMTGGEFFTPPIYFLIIFWPVFVIALVYLLEAKRERKLPAVFWLLLLAATELFFVHDIYGRSARRFNTTLKWWPWVFDGVLLTLAAANLNAVSRVRRYATAGTLGLLLVYLNPLAHHWLYAPKQDFGQLRGDGWLRQDPTLASVVNVLRAEPAGVVLESPDEAAFAQVGAFALFTNKTALLGWTSHEKLWRNNQLGIDKRYFDALGFYKGELTDPLRFLDIYNTRYVLWLPRDNNREGAAEAFKKESAALAPLYDWNEFYRVDNFVVGMWVRRQFSDPAVMPVPGTAVAQER